MPTDELTVVPEAFYLPVGDDEFDSTTATTSPVALAIYTRELFYTHHDEANRSAVAAVGPQISTWSASPCPGRATPSAAL